MKSFARYIIVLLMAFAATGCYDEFMKDEFIGDGESSISATLDFKPMSSALSRTRAAGDALKDIRSLHVLLYDSETKRLLKKWKIADDKYIVTDEERMDADAENGHKAESSTKRATFRLPEKIEFGRYYMYAVANIPDLLTNDSYSSYIQTVDGLKSIPLEWDAEDVTNNGQMIGCLLNASDESLSAEQPYEDESLVINENSTHLHAWLRRAASKVTVAFDGSRLKDGVSIYLKSLRIKNIPKSCFLGMKNTVGSEENLIATGEEVVYSSSVAYDETYSALITNKQPYYPQGELVVGEDGTVSWKKNPNSHSENNPHSLFFYENMQGSGKNMPDKRQKDENNDGKLDALFPYKNMPCATFIEVDAYYESSNPERPGICNITYRFMLGQDIVQDYNAKRNCHYKLTLGFNGFADDPDWRIDYVNRLWVTQPNPVDYRGKYFVPNPSIANLGSTFKDDNSIVVTSFMYKNDSWSEREPLGYKIEYREPGSTQFTEKRPDWLGDFTTEHQGNGVYKLKINYKNPYESVNINKLLADEDRERSETYDLATKGTSEVDSMNTANCYIVDAMGTYTFPLVYGNAITDGKKNSDSYTYKAWLAENLVLKTLKNYKDKGIGNPYILDDIYGSTEDVPDGLKASLIWQDAPNLVKNITYDKELYDGHGGIQFEVGDEIQEGNALIALRDENDTIMWSWHIWVTAFDFSQKVTLTNNDGAKFEIFPINLGWCSGGTDVRYYDRHECEVRFTQLLKNVHAGAQNDASENQQEGMSVTVKIVQEPHIALPQGNNPYFQWGRKDPFVAAGTEKVVLEKKTYNKTKKWYTDEDDKGSDSNPKLMWDDDKRKITKKVVAQLIKNPDKWQNCPRTATGDATRPYEPTDSIYVNLWDNSCWDDNDFVIKTVYDPCPAGYHVSSIYTFTGIIVGGGNKDKDKDIEKKMYVATEDNMMTDAKYKDNMFEIYTDKTKLISLGFPQNGYRDWDDVSLLLTVDKVGEIWHAQAVPWVWGKGYIAYQFEYSRYDKIKPWNNFYATDGFPIRPSKTLPE